MYMYVVFCFGSQVYGKANKMMWSEHENFQCAGCKAVTIAGDLSFNQDDVRWSLDQVGVDARESSCKPCSNIR